MTSKTYYCVLISAGNPTEYRRLTGWDDLHDTREAAEAQAERARENDGWSARVDSVSAEQAAHWHETPGERLARQHAAMRPRNLVAEELAAKHARFTASLRSRA